MNTKRTDRNGERRSGRSSAFNVSIPGSSFLLHSSSFACLLLCVLWLGCASGPPKKEPGVTRIEAEQAYDAGQAAYQRQNWALAASSFGKAAAAFAAVDGYAAEATARHNQAQALRRTGQVDAAMESYQKSLAINQRLKRTSEQAQNLAGLAQCYRAQKKPDLAIHTGEEALKLGSAPGVVRATLENDLALSLLQRGSAADRDRILSLFQSALATHQSLGNQRALAANHLNLGRAQLHFEQTDAASANLEKALDLFRALDDPAGLANTHELLAKLCLRRNDTEKGRFHLEQAREKYEFLRDEASVRRLESLRIEDRR